MRRLQVARRRVGSGIVSAEAWKTARTLLWCLTALVGMRVLVELVHWLGRP